MERLFDLRPFDTLWDVLGGYFPDPRLRQLFGRYATYCGSSPFLAPATLMLIASGLVLRQVLWAPFGDVPAVVSTVTVTNAGASASPSLAYVEQWAAGAPVELVAGLVRPAGWSASFEAVAPAAGGERPCRLEVTP